MQDQIPAAPPPAIISPDRGSFGDSTAIMPQFRLDLETGLTFAWRDRGESERRIINGPEGIARIGLLEDRLEVRALWAGYVDVREDTPAGRSTANGWSDVALGVKLKALDQDGWIPRTVLIAQTFVGAGGHEVAAGVDPTVKAACSWDLGSGVSILTNVGASWPTDGEGRFTQGLGSILASWTVFDATTIFAEYYATFPIVRDDDGAHAVDFGVWQRLGDSVQLDFRVGFGLNAAADDVLLGAGIAFLF